MTSAEKLAQWIAAQEALLVKIEAGLFGRTEEERTAQEAALAQIRRDLAKVKASLEKAE